MITHDVLFILALGRPAELNIYHWRRVSTEDYYLSWGI